MPKESGERLAPGCIGIQKWLKLDCELNPDLVVLAYGTNEAADSDYRMVTIVPI